MLIRIYRVMTALALAAIICCAPLNLAASARPRRERVYAVGLNDTSLARINGDKGAGATQSEGAGAEVDSFIIETKGGVITCRDARLEEVPFTLPRPDDTRTPVRRNFINGGKAGDDTDTQGEVVAGGLQINLIALSQLNNDPQKQTIIAAFQRAAAIWEGRIKSPVVVNLNIDYGFNLPDGSAFPPNVIGSTSNRRIQIDYAGLRRNLLASASSVAERALYDALPVSVVTTDTGNGALVNVARALARPLGLPAPVSPLDDATISFNKNVPFDFNPDDGIDANKSSFVSVAAHEIGHALGFTSNAGRGSTANVSVWDIFRFKPGTTIDSFPTATRILSIGQNPFDSQVYFTGQSFNIIRLSDRANLTTTELELSTGGPNPSASDGDGKQSSHWKDDALTGRYIGVMDPASVRGEGKQVTENDFSLLETVGWDLTGNAVIPPAPPDPPPPFNDNFDQSQALNGCSGTAKGINVGATTEPNEPRIPESPTATRSVWYRWQAPVTGSVTISTSGSGFDTVLAVYAGNNLGGLTLVGSNDDTDDPNTAEAEVSSLVTFTATQGATYRINVDGFDNGGTGGDMGSFKLNWSQSNCVAAPANPIDDAQFFVRQHYRDFLGRDPDAPGLAFWTDNINLCNDPARRPTGQSVEQCVDKQRVTTSAAFFLSPEFQYTGYFAYRLYKGALGRQPLLSEFLIDVPKVASNIIQNNQLSAATVEENKKKFVEDFILRTEFKSIYDSLSNQDYVQRLFQTTGVQVSDSDKQMLVQGLNNQTETRATVLQKIVDGAVVISEGNQQFTTSYGKAFYDVEFHNAFVLMEYFGYMRRDPDAPGYQHWLGKLNFYGNYIDAEMVRSFVVSPEYRARFGQP